MTKKRITPPDEFDRFAETLMREFPGDYDDEDEYNEYFDKWFEQNDLDPTPRQDTVMRKQTWEFVKDKRLFRRAGGKNLKQDRMKDAKVIVNSKKEYIRRGAKRSDLKGYDTKRRDFDVTAEVKGRVVFAYKDSVVVKGKTQPRLRARNGQFAKQIK